MIETNLKLLDDDQLHTSALRTAEEARKITLCLLKHLNEVERRHLFSKFNVSSLHGYCVNELKMDDASAGRHVNAARLLREIPVIEEKIIKGSMCLTSVSQAGVFFRKEAQNDNEFDLKAKRETVMALENKTTREVDRFLISKSSNPEIHFKEKVTAKSETITELKIHIDAETLAAIERMRELWSHAMPNANVADILKRAIREAVEKHDPLNKIARAEKRTARRTSEEVVQPGINSSMENAIGNVALTPAPESKAMIRRSIWKRDRSQCTFVDPRTEERCVARHFVEEDHVIPKAMGGEFSFENIRLRCRAHNQRHAIDSYGFFEDERSFVDHATLSQRCLNGKVGSRSRRSRNAIDGRSSRRSRNASNRRPRSNQIAINRRGAP